MDNPGPVDASRLRPLLTDPDLFCSGRCSSVSKHPTENVVVSVHDCTFTFGLYYRVGICDYNGEIDWSPECKYDSGAFPSVAVIHFNGEFYVLETHVVSDCVRTCYLNFGKVDVNAKTIRWSQPDNNKAFLRLGSGKKPKLCANDEGIFLIASEKAFTRNSIQYWSGRLQNIRNQEVRVGWAPIIDWNSGGKPAIIDFTGVEPDIALSNRVVTLIWRTTAKEVQSIMGTVNDRNEIVFDDPTSVQELPSPGMCPSISINARGFRFACLQTSRGRQIRRYFGHNSIKWSPVSTQSYFGEYPTVSLDDDGVIIEIHKTNFGTTLYKSEGELRGMDLAMPNQEAEQ